MQPTLNPAETLAALKLLETALKDAIADAATAAEDYQRQVRAKTLETDWGTVTIARRKSGWTIDEDALVEWFRSSAPTELEVRVKPAARKAFEAQLTIDSDGDVIGPDGDVLDWVAVKPGTEYLTTRLTPEAKRAATEAVTARLDAFLAPLALEGGDLA